jgi:hypothetical protein
MLSASCSRAWSVAGCLASTHPDVDQAYTREAIPPFDQRDTGRWTAGTVQPSPAAARPEQRPSPSGRSRCPDHQRLGYPDQRNALGGHTHGRGHRHYAAGGMSRPSQFTYIIAAQVSGIICATGNPAGGPAATGYRSWLQGLADVESGPQTPPRTPRALPRT